MGIVLLVGSKVCTAQFKRINFWCNFTTPNLSLGCCGIGTPSRGVASCGNAICCDCPVTTTNTCGGILVCPSGCPLPVTKCGGERFLSASITPSTNGVCSVLTNCTLGTNYQSQPPTATSDRACGDTVTNCTLGTNFQSKPPTLTSDRVCGTCATCCSGNYPLEIAMPTPTSNRLCGKVPQVQPQTFWKEMALASLSTIGAALCFCLGIIMWRRWHGRQSVGNASMNDATIPFLHSTQNSLSRRADCPPEYEDEMPWRDEMDSTLSDGKGQPRPSAPQSSKADPSSYAHFKSLSAQTHSGSVHTRTSTHSATHTHEEEEDVYQLV
jgi:hypothetical protein